MSEQYEWSITTVQQNASTDREAAERAARPLELHDPLSRDVDAPVL